MFKIFLFFNTYILFPWILLYSPKESCYIVALMRFQHSLTTLNKIFSGYVLFFFFLLNRKVMINALTAMLLSSPGLNKNQKNTQKKKGNKKENTHSEAPMKV